MFLITCLLILIVFYIETLGVNRGASQKDIKAAYYKLAQ